VAPSKIMAYISVSQSHHAWDTLCIVLMVYTTSKEGFYLSVQVRFFEGLENALKNHQKSYSGTLATS